MRRPTTQASLYRLIYRSRQVIADVILDGGTEAGLQRELRAIVAAARLRNKAADLTGALMFTAAGFTQVLEGPRDAVERTFERIALDPRHTDVTMLSFTPALRRSFPDWALGFCGRILPVPAAVPADGIAPPTGSDTLRLLESVVQQEDAWIDA